MDWKCRIVTGRELPPQTLIDFWADNDVSLSATDNARQLATAAELHPELFLVALDQERDTVAGTVWGNFDGRRGFVVHLATRRDLRGRGLGSFLMEQLEQRFRERGVYKVHLFVETSHPELVEFYEAKGYCVRHDLVLMSKTLE